ncbi:MAG TPA: patatin-like phospholipase family protein [Longilinea sp.]|nr:patatin-like phospholipase family protein [Longilinea sp.]
MNKCLALVLGGGGARGALQVGACQALFEAGYQPDLIVGTSIGAANAAALGLWGANLAALEKLDAAYQEAADSQLMDSRLARLVVQFVAGRMDRQGSRLVGRFMASKGITSTLRFDELTGARIGLVGADLESGEPVIYGKSPDQSVMEGVLASTAIQPWFTPIEKDGHWIVDGGFVSGLPIEPAMTLGATEIIALDLNDPYGGLGRDDPRSQYIEKVIFSINQRQANLELALAAARGVTVRYLPLRSSPSVTIWDFSKHRQLFQNGYETTCKEIQGWKQPNWSPIAQVARQIFAEGCSQ